jgi:hypothetical protein
MKHLNSKSGTIGLGYLFKKTGLPVFLAIIPVKVAPIHGNVHSRWQGLSKCQRTSQIK